MKIYCIFTVIPLAILNDMLRDEVIAPWLAVKLREN
jgi:hypothetical protein